MLARGGGVGVGGGSWDGSNNNNHVVGGSEMACMMSQPHLRAKWQKILCGAHLSWSHGADISFVRVYLGEKGELCPPLTYEYMHPIKLSEETIGTPCAKLSKLFPSCTYDTIFIKTFYDHASAFIAHVPYCIVREWK